MKFDFDVVRILENIILYGVVRDWLPHVELATNAEENF